MHVAMTSTGGRSVLDAIMAVVTRTLPSANSTTTIFGSGLTDSMAFLDLILEVETQTGMTFDPDSLELDDAISPIKMALAFKAQE